MSIDVEEIVGRELHAVADGLRVPPLPDLAAEASRPRRPWVPVVAAAALILVVALAASLAMGLRGDRAPSPAPAPTPSPTPTQSPSATKTEPAGTLPTAASDLAHVLDRKLYVGGAQVPGEWWSVQPGGETWLALRTDNTWWWGRGTDAHPIEGRLDVPPVLSPNGEYVGMIVTDHGTTTLSGFDTEPDGEGFGGVSIDPGDRQQGTTVSVRAVTDDGRVVAQGSETAILWLPLTSGDTVDLTRTAPGHQIVAGRAGGLIVDEEAPYLAEISDAGELTRLRDLPVHDDLIVSPDATWLVWTPGGTIGGEVTTISRLEARSVDDARSTTLTAPKGWGFSVLSWAWEDDEHIVSPVLPDGEGASRMARCSVLLGRCVLIDGP